MNQIERYTNEHETLVGRWVTTIALKLTEPLNPKTGLNLGSVLYVEALMGDVLMVRGYGTPLSEINRLDRTGNPRLFGVLNTPQKGQALFLKPYEDRKTQNGTSRDFAKDMPLDVPMYFDSLSGRGNFICRNDPYKYHMSWFSWTTHFEPGDIVHIIGDKELLTVVYSSENITQLNNGATIPTTQLVIANDKVQWQVGLGHKCTPFAMPYAEAKAIAEKTKGELIPCL